MRWCDQLCSHSGLGKDPSRHGSCKEPCHGWKVALFEQVFFCSLDDFFLEAHEKTHYLKVHHIYLALSYGICEQHSNSQQSTRYTIYLPSQQLARPSHWLLVFCHSHKKNRAAPKRRGPWAGHKMAREGQAFWMVVSGGVVGIMKLLAKKLQPYLFWANYNDVSRGHLKLWWL